MGWFFSYVRTVVSLLKIEEIEERIDSLLIFFLFKKVFAYIDTLYTVYEIRISSTATVLQRK